MTDFEYYSVLYQQRMAALDAAEAQVEANLKRTYSQGGDMAEDQDALVTLASIHAERKGAPRLRAAKGRASPASTFRRRSVLKRKPLAPSRIGVTPGT